MKSASADSERFCFPGKQEKQRNPGCISCFSYCTGETKDPLLSRRRFVQRFPGEALNKSARADSERFCFVHIGFTQLLDKLEVVSISMGRLPLPMGEVPAGRRGPSQSASLPALPKGEPRCFWEFDCPSNSNLSVC